MKEKKSNNISKKKKLLYTTIAILLSILMIFIVAEVSLRIIPIPGVEYNVSKYDTLTGNGYYPNSVYFYRNDKGDFVKRKINKWGYLDKNYEKDKKENIIRIGFFGDSYTAAKQVKLNETFHKIIEQNLSKYNIETLSFGVEGFSTWQSYLTYNKWTDFFDIDYVVYVFFENDLGDQIKAIKKAPISYPVLYENKLTIDNSFRTNRKSKLSISFRIVDYLTANSLFFATLSNRFHLLLKYGIKTKVTKEDRYLVDSDKGLIKYPPNLQLADTPSHWPDSLKEYAESLEEFILLKWKREVEQRHKMFLILYTPRDIHTPTDEQDSWKQWLSNFCSENNIPFIDPTEKLKEMEENGNEVFYDHYTKHGHSAVADEFTNWFLQNIVKDQTLSHT